MNECPLKMGPSQKEIHFFNQFFKEQTCKLLVVGGEQLGEKHCHVSPTALYITHLGGMKNMQINQINLGGVPFICIIYGISRP